MGTAQSSCVPVLRPLPPRPGGSSALGPTRVSSSLLTRHARTLLGGACVLRDKREQERQGQPQADVANWQQA
eukprot:6191749-Pleurochrysis_carterae.AAC.2